MDRMGIEYQQGDATAPGGDGPRVIVHVCNDVGGWGRGFVLALSQRHPAAEHGYREWHRRRSGFELGAVQFVAVADKLWVANLVGQHGIRWEQGVPPIRYDAVRRGLQEVRSFATAQGASVHMPRIGAGLAGGDWKRIEAIIAEELQDIDVTVYTLAPEVGGVG